MSLNKSWSNPFRDPQEDESAFYTARAGDDAYTSLVASTEKYQDARRYPKKNPFKVAEDPFNTKTLSPQERYPPLPEFDEQVGYGAFDRNKQDTLEKTLDPQQQSQWRRTRQVAAFLFGRHTGWPLFTYLVTAIQVIVFVVELVKMGIYTGNPFQTKPYFNPMLGPSTYVQIHLGARYLPCMTYVDGITNQTDITWPCPNSTNTDTNVCSLEQLCGMGGFPEDSDTELPNPNQWWRMITPMFLHAGILHILFNLLLQVMMGPKLERFIGFLRFGFIYLACGISGFLLGANFTPAGISSTGASGALFGACIGLDLLLLLLNNNMDHFSGPNGPPNTSRKQFKVYLFGSLIEIVVMIVLGLLPGLDNFSHIGGFVVGISLGIAFLNDPVFVYRTESRPGFLHQRNHWFYVWCVLRVVAFVLTIVYFCLLARNFAEKGVDASESCKWCKYINCLPVNGWCDTGNLSVSYSTSLPISIAPLFFWARQLFL